MNGQPPSTRRGLLVLAGAALADLAALGALAGPARAGTTAPPGHDLAVPDDNPVEPTRRTPRYLLLGSHGRAVTSEDFQGRFQLIAFGFISCPSVCPTTLMEMQQVLVALGPRAAQLQPLFITVDPQRDSPAVLAEYTRAFDSRILGLTGSDALVRRAADSFKVSYEKVREPGAAPEAYTMNHSAGMFLLGPDGQLLGKFAYNTPVPDIVARLEHWLALANR